VFPSKRELFEGKGVKWLMGWWLRSMGQVPIDRGGGLEVLRPLIDILESGGGVAIFPEGTRSPDGRLYKGHTGVARLALATGAPVVPVGLLNMRIHPGRFGVPGLTRGSMTFGPPLSFSGDPADRGALRDVTDEVMGAIQRITGQEYVEIYAQDAKKALGA